MWNPKAETMSRDDIEKLQNELLKKLLQRLQTVPFYRKILSGIDIDNFTLERLPELPFTTKDDLRDHYPFGLFAVPLDKVVRIHASSGTTGKPTVVGYSQKDIETWTELCARSLVMSGCRPGQMFQNAYGYGLFTGGLGMHYGAEKLGLSVIPASGGNTARQVMILRDFGPHIVACTPSYALTLIDKLQDVPRDDLNIETFILGAEPWTEVMRQEIEQKLKVNAINIYGLSEIIGPGVSCECVEAKQGAHIFEDHFIAEVISPETQEVLEDGQVGELVFTTLTKEAFPLLRYRTGDLASITKEPSCGRTHTRMSRVLGRVDDMLIIRGVNIFPSQIEEALAGLPKITPHHQIVVERRGRLDCLNICVEIDEGISLNTEESLYLQKQIAQAVKNIVGINIEVSLSPPGSIPRSEGGKLNRVVDKRD